MMPSSGTIRWVSFLLSESVYCDALLLESFRFTKYSLKSLGKVWTSTAYPWFWLAERWSVIVRRSRIK